MAEINLLAQSKKGFFSTERLLVTTRVAAVVSVVTVTSLSILFFLLSRDPSVVQIKAQRSKTIAQLTLLQDKTAKYLLILDRVNKIQQIQKNQTHFGTNIAVLAEQIPINISVTNFTIDKTTMSLALSGKDLSLLGKAVDNFSQLVMQKNVLKGLTIEGLVSDEKGQSYVLTLSGNIL